MFIINFIDSESSEATVIESDDEIVEDESNDEPEMNLENGSNEESNDETSDIAIIESQQSIISISSDSDSDANEVLETLRQSVTNEIERNVNVTRYLLNRAMSMPSPTSMPSPSSSQSSLLSLHFSQQSSPSMSSSPSTPSPISLHFSPPSSPDLW